MSTFDRKQPKADFDPTKQIQYSIADAQREAGNNLFQLMNIGDTANQDLVKQVAEAIMQAQTTMDKMVDDLNAWANSLIASILTPEQKAQYDELMAYEQAKKDAWQTLMNQLWRILTNPQPDFKTLLQKADAAWQDYLGINKDINLDESVTFNAFLSSLLGFDIETGKILPSTVQGLNENWAQLEAAIGGDKDNSGGWAWLADWSWIWTTRSDNAYEIGSDNTEVIENKNNKPLAWGLDDTTESNIPFHPRPDALTLSSGKQFFVPVRCTQKSIKNAIAFIASTTTSNASLYTAVYKANFETETFEYIADSMSDDFAPQLAASKKWLFASAHQAEVEKIGDVIVIGFNCQSGSVILYGEHGDVPAHPNAKLPGLVASRTSNGLTADIPFSEFTFDNSSVPYVGLEISNPPPPVYPPKEYVVTLSRSLVPPVWAKHADLIGKGAGGGGGGGIWGQGDNTGHPGTNTVVTANNRRVINAPGGSGAPGGLASTPDMNGESAGVYIWDGWLTAWGGQQVSYQHNGDAPGGGAGGGQFMNFYGYGGNAGGWDVTTIDVTNVASLDIMIGQGGKPNQRSQDVPQDVGAFGAGFGGRGQLWVRFRQD